MTLRRVGHIQRVLEATLESELASPRLLPHLLAGAASRRGLEIPQDELARLATAMLSSDGSKGDSLEIDLDLPCAMGDTEAAVEATVQALVDELMRLMPELEVLLSDAVADTVPATLQALAASIDEEFSRNAQEHARQIAQSRVDRTQAVDHLWGRALEGLDFMRHLVLEWSAVAGEVGNGPFTSQDTARALASLIRRSFDIVGEVLVLARHGYADGALARWRSLHEVCVVAMYLAQRDERCSTMYLSHHKVEEYHLLGAEGISLRADRYATDLRAKRIALVARFGEAFAADYGWAAVDLGRKRVTFRDLEEKVGMEKLRHGYKRASNAVHGGPLAALTRVSVGVGAPSDLPPVFGCGAAASFCVASLSMLVADLCINADSADLIAMNFVIQQRAATVRAQIERSQGQVSVDSPRSRILARKSARRLKCGAFRPVFRR